MPYGMGPAGWFMWPYWARGMGYSYPGYEAPYYGYPGYGAPYAPPITKEQEITMLQDQAKMLEEQLKQINARLEELQKTK